MGDELIWDLERSFWLEGITAYEANLHDEAVMVFPGLGILDRHAVIESIRYAERWRDVQMTGQRTITTGGMAVLAYAAEAERAGSARYRANCISTYVHQPEGWRMVSHQQTSV
jgi:hypothetical protein